MAPNPQAQMSPSSVPLQPHWRGALIALASPDAKTLAPYLYMLFLDGPLFIAWAW